MKKENQNQTAIILSISLLHFIIYMATQVFFSYGLFRDEYYYLACANRLDWGYVDHPPLSIFILAFWKILLGDGLLAIRFVPAVVTSVNLILLGLFTQRLGGKTPAVVIAMITYMFTPIFLGMNTIYSMNAFDFLFWIASAYVFLKIIRIDNAAGRRRYWLVLGVVLGMGLLNKTSIIWLGAGIFAGTILTPLRKDLRSVYPYTALLIALVLFSPYVIWNILHDFAHLEFMRNAASIKYSGLNPLTFIFDQILVLNPVSFLIWLPGIIFYFFRKDSEDFRAAGYIWLTTFIILLINGHSKGEYISHAYQILFAAGAVLIEKWSESPRLKWIKYSVAAVVVISGILLLPFARPVLSPAKFLDYQSFIGLKPPSNEGHETLMPQFYSDMFGWEEMAKNVSEVFESLPDYQKENTFVFCSNYGRAGAIEYYSRKYALPGVLCSHNNYWYWWPDSILQSDHKNDLTIIIIGGEEQEHLEALEEVYEAGFHKAEYAMPYENNLRIFIGKGLRIPVQEVKKKEKSFI